MAQYRELATFAQFGTADLDKVRVHSSSAVSALPNF
jgi:hypothetical protein